MRKGILQLLVSFSFAITMLMLVQNENKRHISLMQAKIDSLKMELQKSYPSEVELNRYINTLEFLYETDSITAQKFYQTLTNKTE